MLTSYAGTAITYDAIGNPLSYYNGSSYSFVWTGRQLSSASKGGYTYNFTYNDAGIRTSKTKNGVTTTYYLNGSQIMAEETNGNITVYIYDASGTPIGMQYRGANYSANTWDTYWYEKNLFGDIVAIYNHSGTKLVSYVYDAWGNFTTTYHNGTASTSVVAKNPFKYRGYYYDADLGLYYLQTRYYDSNTGRFINADSALCHNMLGYNMFVYCNNNPINYYDPNGEDALALLWGWITGAGSVAAAEPTPVGEIIVGFGIVVIGTAVVGEKIVDGIKYIGNLLEEEDDAPHSITEPKDNQEDSKDKDATSENKLPMEDEPNTDRHLRDEKGIKQTRHYGPDGKAEYDIDYRHGGAKHKFPHKHKWTWDGTGWNRSGSIDIF